MNTEHPLQFAGVLADAVFTASVILGSVAAVSAHSDSWVTTKAKITLLANGTVNASTVDVDAADGHVTLQGEVASATEKETIENLVRGVDGVREVESLLTVVPREIPKRTRGDAEIEAAVRDAFATDRNLSSSDIDVVSVDDGIVTLDGDAVTMTAHARALQTAFRVPGVLGLKASIDSPDVLSETEMIAHASAQKLPAPSLAMEAAKPASFGGTLRDWWITATTKMRLIGNTTTPALDIDVDTENGAVTLFGLVPSSAARAAAEAEATAVAGVTGVRNELQIVQADRQANVEASDDALRTVIASRMASRTDFDDAGIDVSVSNGIVRLTGTVDDGSDRLAAVDCARAVPGVRSAINDLRVPQVTGATE